MKLVRFTKMHGIGNDYVYLTAMPCEPEQLPELARRMSSRHCGVGGDGIILVLPSAVADFQMRIFNADGSEAAMCGNGSRCVGKLVYDSGMTRSTDITLETGGGIRRLKLHPGPDGKVDSVTVDMGCAVTSEPLTLQSGLGPVEVTPVNVGNPHGVVFIEHDPAEVALESVGPRLEHDPVWPDRANIEFAHVLTPHHIIMRVWERGSGETMACGTGACAVVAAAARHGLISTHSPVRVDLPGGSLHIALEMPSGRVMMTGPATTVFTGEYIITD